MRERLSVWEGKVCYLNEPWGQRLPPLPPLSLRAESSGLEPARPGVGLGRCAPLSARSLQCRPCCPFRAGIPAPSLFLFFPQRREAPAAVSQTLGCNTSSPAHPPASGASSRARPRGKDQPPPAHPAAHSKSQRFGLWEAVEPVC